jgi:NAD-dependent dihydropyrimidine dehydrogenase PreA subunit
MAKPLPNTQQQTFEAEEFGAIAKDLDGADKAAIARACAALRGNMMRATMHPIGCRAVQAMLEKADKEDKAELLGELHGNVKWAIWSPSGNYVIQKIVEVCPGNVWSFVVDELQGSEKSVARHRFGCRIWCRLMEHGDWQNPGLSARTDELIAVAGELSHHPFAHYAVHAILEHGTEDQRRRVGLALLGSLSHDANHRHCSRVIESALEHCPPDVQHALVEELMRTGAEGLASLARKRYGSFVVTALLQRAGESSMNVCNQLAAQATTLCHTKRGQRLLQDIGVQHIRMPMASLGA